MSPFEKCWSLEAPRRAFCAGCDAMGPPVPLSGRLRCESPGQLSRFKPYWSWLCTQVRARCYPLPAASVALTFPVAAAAPAATALSVSLVEIESGSAEIFS